MEECSISLKPDAAYNLIHTVLFGCLALSTMRVLNVQENCVQNFSNISLPCRIDKRIVKRQKTCLYSFRMKYLWTSHMCVFASFGLCSTEIWQLILKCVRLYTSQRVSTMLTAFLKTQVIKYLIPIMILVYILYKFWPGIMDELLELREFYDPDTVELMNWIKLSVNSGDPWR
ncbi:UNVERIFIED_CONTAM: hypothetical protein H355_015516 [Colinus virginianus]|nr:hypothetical protein H355_015516 [Colinus virginianus]